MRFLAVDGGGTKTRIVVFDESSNIEFSKVSGPSNPLTVGLEGTLKALEGVRGPFDVAVLGIAGVASSGRLRSELEGLLKDRLNAKRLLLLSDVHTTAVGALGGKKGVAVIAGTGSVVVGYDQGEFSRCGGWGYILGDEGSGYRLTVDSIREVLKHLEGRGKGTRLLNALKTHFSVSSYEDLIALVYTRSRDEVASFAPVFLEIVSSGDPVARSVLESNLKDLIDCVLHLVRRMDVRGVTYSGGLFESETFLKSFSDMLEKNGISVIEPQGSALEGAMILALKNADEFVKNPARSGVTQDLSPRNRNRHGSQ